MTTVNQGRNEIRFNNSDGKCLLENWVEERAVGEQHLTEEQKTAQKTLKVGHPGLLTINVSAEAEKLTTFTESYRPPSHPGVRQKGAKQEMLEQMLYDQISQQVDAEFNAPPETEDMKSVTHTDYNKDEFVPTPMEPTGHHNYVADQPVSFWTEHKDKMHGISQIKTSFDTAFRKNTAFSKPIEEYFDQPKPHDFEVVPKM